MLVPVRPDNIDSLIQLGAEWAHESAVDSYDPESWRQSVRNYAILVDHCARLWQDNLGQPRGFVLGTVLALPHSAERRAQIHYIYLAPDHLELVNLQEIEAGFAAWAQEFGVEQIQAPDLVPMPAAYRLLFDEMGYGAQEPALSRGTI